MIRRRNLKARSLAKQGKMRFRHCDGRRRVVLRLQEKRVDAKWKLRQKFLHRILLAQFREFLRRQPDVYRLVTEEISMQYTMACDQLRTVGLSSTAPEKLARLLLDMSENGQPTAQGTRFRFILTHEQIGEFIGTSTMANAFEVNGAASIGYVDTTAPTNGLLVKGNVGIGTTSPNALLHVVGTAATHPL